MSTSPIKPTPRGSRSGGAVVAGWSRRRATGSGSTRPHVCRRGFTLIELLVVISIIAILVAITMPALASAKETARRVTCMTQLKGFGVAIQLYMDVNKDRLPYVLPFYNDEFPTDPNDPQLLDVLADYIDVPPPHKDENGVLKVYAPYLCPSDKDDDAGRATGFSYEYWAGGLMVLRELFAADPDPAGTVKRFYEGNPKFPVLADAKPWHSGGVQYNQNALYYGDWHVDWLRLDPEEDRPDDFLPPP